MTKTPTSTYTREVAPGKAAAAADRTTKGRPARVTPRANFIGVLGKRPARRTHRIPKSGASTMIEIGLTLWNHSSEKSKPSESRSVRLAA